MPLRSLSPFLIGRTVCSPNILRTVRRTIIRFLTELLLRRTCFGQFDELCFVLNWLIMRCKLRPELGRSAADSMTPKCRLKSIYFNHPAPGNSINYYIILVLRDKAAPPTSQQIGQLPSKRVKYRHVIHYYFFLIHRRALCSQPIRGNACRTGRIFPEHVERSFLDPE